MPNSSRGRAGKRPLPRGPISKNAPSWFDHIPGKRHSRSIKAIENIPAGFRAKETYLLTGADQVEEMFELAEPGTEFEVYSRTRLTRTR